MRYLLLAISIIALSASQSFSAGNILLTGGLNIADLDMDKNESHYSGWVNGSSEYQNRIGFNAGAAYDLILTEYFSLAAGISAETRGIRYETDLSIPALGTHSHSERDIRFMYLDIPAAGILRFEAGPGNIFGQAGMELGFLLDAETRYTDDQGTETENDADDDYETVDFGFSLGGGYELDLSAGFLFLKACYYWGFLDINDTGSGGDIHNRVFRINLGYGIRL